MSITSPKDGKKIEKETFHWVLLQHLILPVINIFLIVHMYYHWIRLNLIFSMIETFLRRDDKLQRVSDCPITDLATWARSLCSWTIFLAPFSIWSRPYRRSSMPLTSFMLGLSTCLKVSVTSSIRLSSTGWSSCSVAFKHWWTMSCKLCLGSYKTLNWLHVMEKSIRPYA